MEKQLIPWLFSLWVSRCVICIIPSVWKIKMASALLYILQKVRCWKKILYGYVNMIYDVSILRMQLKRERIWLRGLKTVKKKEWNISTLCSWFLHCISKGNNHLVYGKYWINTRTENKSSQVWRKFDKKKD